jgi:P-type Cu2+ transporter
MSSRHIANGVRQTTLSIPAMHCAACIGAVEKTLSKLQGVERARVNLSTRTVTVNWKSDDGRPPDMIEALELAGYSSNLPSSAVENEDPYLAWLVRALAVAGFCSMNIMLLSVSVWSGAEPDTRQLFHLLSAALAFPAVFYSGGVFYVSAWRALSRGRLNMDVPVSAGVLLSFGLSLFDTIAHAPLAYFEASTSLVFVLLAGRVLDHMMRRKAKSAVAALARMLPRGANVLAEDGHMDYVALDDIRSGMRLLVASGERVPADGTVVDGESEVDSSLVTGESAWKSIEHGSEVWAGELNLGNPFTLATTAAPADSMLSEMRRMLQAAEDGRSTYRRLADRAATLYAPVVHSLSALAFLWWLLMTGDVHRALTVAITVLVITCPCALGLAVPMVQVVLARRLFDDGVMASDGSAFERLGEIHTVIFDKTGTLTTGQPILLNVDGIAREHLALAGSMSRWSKHPFSRAISFAHGKTGLETIPLTEVREIAGMGLEGSLGDTVYRLGKPSWVANDAMTPGRSESVVLSTNGRSVASFELGETVRPGATELIRSLKAKAVDVLILSGDQEAAVRTVASAVGIEDYRACLLPGAKFAAVEALQSEGRKVLMIGDGVNDAPALKAAHVSMAPSTASDIGRSAADFVFLGDSLAAVKNTIETVSRANALIRQNFALAIVYNLVSLPIALLGYVTPLAAAIAMSASSIMVVANALRLRPAARKGASEEPNAATALRAMA